MAISDILTQVTAIVTASVGWIGQFVDSITDNPILLMFVIFGFIGTGVGLISRIIKLR